MWSILLVTADRDSWTPAAAALEADGRCRIDWVGGFDAALDRVRRQRPALVVVDREVDGRDGLELCREILMIDAFAQQALAADMDEETFHEASEGLGLLGCISRPPAAADAQRLLEWLAAVAPNGG